MSINLPETTGEFIIYTTEDGKTEVHLRVIDETVWMTQTDMADLFDITTATINTHLKSIYSDTELTRDRTIRKFQRVQSEGDRDISRSLIHYNLDVVMAVGYRVRGPRGIQFRTWATSVLKEYLIKGFALNDEKLKDPAGKDYFQELLERIRDIRASEARFYQQIKDIFATSIDYNPNDPSVGKKFATIQNKLHFAITGNTAAEILAMRSDPALPNMGLTNFSGSIVRKKDVKVAKNYLNEEELRRLNRLTTAFLDHAEMQAERRKEMRMEDWITQTDKFIDFNEYPLLDGRGKINHDQAVKKAEERYELFKDTQSKSGNDAAQIEEMKRIEQEILRDRKRLER